MGKSRKHLKAAALPLLFAVSPIIFLYSHNIKVLNLGNLVLPVLIAVIAAMALYGLFYFIQRKTLSASMTAVIFIGANYMYGNVYDLLTEYNRFPVEHFVLLPVMLYLAFYAAYFFNFLNAGLRKAARSILLVMTLAVIGYNLITAVPAEIQKANLAKPAPASAAAASSDPQKKQPDVYFILLDEYAGFKSVREYFHKDYVDDFEKFLKEKGFVVVDNTRAPTSATNLEMAGRLNIRSYPWNTNPLTLTQDIVNNKVMRLFKSYGYTTVAFPGPFPKYTADYNFYFRANDDSQAVGTGEFQRVLIENTMLNGFSDLLLNTETSARSLSAINSTFEKISDLDEIPSPKLVVAHLLFPHVPFVSDREGKVLNPKYQYNWNYYIGQHEYATSQAQALIERLLENADPQNPPIIIIESDHGARNEKLPTRDSVVFDDFPEEYTVDILFAMYLPGVDTSDIAMNTPPVESFAIVLNKYFNAGVSVEILPGSEQ
jgi:hypothetical protein